MFPAAAVGRAAEEKLYRLEYLQFIRGDATIMESVSI